MADRKLKPEAAPDVTPLAESASGDRLTVIEARLTALEALAEKAGPPANASSFREEFGKLQARFQALVTHPHIAALVGKTPPGEPPQA